MHASEVNIVTPQNALCNDNNKKLKKQKQSKGQTTQHILTCLNNGRLKEWKLVK